MQTKWFGRVAILSFWIFSAWYLYIGGLLTQALTFGESLAAIAAANLIFVLIFTFYAGTSKPKDVLFMEAFGNAGAKYYISPLPSLTQIGWYAVVVEIGGTAFALMLGLEKATTSFFEVILGYGFFTMWIAAGGLQRIGKLSFISTPAMLGFTVWSAYAIVQQLGLDNLLAYQPIHQSAHSLAFGIQLLMASFISAAVTIPDFLHELDSKKSIFFASFWGLVPTTLIVGGLGAAFAIIGRSYDVLATLQLMSGPMFVYGLLSVDNLCGAQAVFPVGTGLASIHASTSKEIQEKRRKLWTVLGGSVSIALAMIGIVGWLETWLTILGTIFSPIIGVVLANQYFVKKDFSSEGVFLPAMASWLLGCAFSFVPVGIPILQALLAALVSFTVINKLTTR